MKWDGFTIVETMIVLAITTLLFGSALALVGGKQNQAAFTTGIKNAQQSLQQIINETASGYYPSNNDFTCSATATSLSFSSVATDQGSNGQCVFLGKALQFAVGSADSATYNTYPVAAWSGATGSLASLSPALLASGSSGTTPDHTASQNLQNGLTVASMYYNDDTTKKIAGMAFLSSPGTNDTVTSTLQAGTQKLYLVAINGGTHDTTSTLGEAKTHFVDHFATRFPGVPIGDGGGSAAALSDVDICFQSGGTNQSGLVTITADLAVTLKIYGNTTCS